ncbi:MAG: ATP-dependent sacrificial sulfur transferase LarE [Promethearchaeota archaeon]|nr:MAG: ATP-dependent sacrificial sulfur transferase LarE [Candidatus Lokiarchaeota archaeon]
MVRREIMQLSVELTKKLDMLASFLKNKKIIVAFSGGVDSSLLAYLSNKYAKETLLLIAESDLNAIDELKEAKDFAKKYNIPHREVGLNLLENKEFIKNPENRCYICKKELFSKFLAIKQTESYNLVIDGSNANDKKDFRPGMRALDDLDIESPFILFDINKQEIRSLSQHFHLETYSKPSSACLASRIPYNQKITKEKLEMIGQAEKFLKRQFGLKQVRVRYHKNRLARIEVHPEEMKKILNQRCFRQIKERFKQLGFVYIAIDIEGFRSGSLNEILDEL